MRCEKHKCRHGIGNSNLLRWTTHQNHDKNWYSKDSKIRLRCESAELPCHSTSKSEIQKELPLRTEIYEYS